MPLVARNGTRRSRNMLAAVDGNITKSISLFVIAFGVAFVLVRACVCVICYLKNNLRVLPCFVVINGNIDASLA